MFNILKIRVLFSSLLLLIFCGNSITNCKNIEKIQVGVIRGIIFGDYLYFSISIDGAAPEDFYCLTWKCAEWEQGRTELIGSRVKVTWRKKEFYIKQLGALKKVKELLMLKEISFEKSVRKED